MLSVLPRGYRLMNLTMPYKRSDEAEIIAQYLVGRPASLGARESYERALQNIPVIFTEKQKLQWDACMKNSWLLPHVDAWLALTQPDHPIRKKIFIMLGVLETQADYSDLFLPSTTPFFQLLVIFCRGMWAVTKIITGRLVTWII